MSKIFKAFHSILAIIVLSFGQEVCLQATSVAEVENSLFPTREMRAETIYMVRCMEELHLEHKTISLLDNRTIMIEFLSELDHGKMIFLQKDVDTLVKKFVPTLDIFISGGSLVPAFNAFEKFRTIFYGRMDWVFTRMDEGFDFSKDDFISLNRKDCNWPQTEEEADILWEKRLKFDVINEAMSLCKLNKSKNKNSGSFNETLMPVENFGKNIKETCNLPDQSTENGIENFLSEAIKNVKRRYENLRRTYKDFDAWVLQEMFLNSISKMYDPHTSFLSKDSFEDLSTHIHNSLIGIGAELRDENGECTIEKLMSGGPAKLSGEIKAGDKIIAVAQGDDGEFVDIVGLRLYKTVKLLRGKKGTVVRIKLETVSGDTKVVRLVRDHIKLNATRAKAKYFELKQGDNVAKIGVIELPSFYGDVNPNNEQCVYANRDIKTLLEMLKNKGIDGLILDLRQNGGGLLNQAVSIAGLFIKTGPVVQVKDSFGKIEQFYDENEDIAWGGPLIVLSSSMSASASEILIGALHDHRRAIIVGAEATYGKGSVQVALDMNTFFNSLGGNKDLGAAYITVQKWYLPTGVSTQLKGVPADIKLPSLDECFHKREADYPWALNCDTIPPIEFDYDSGLESNRCYVTEDLISKLSEKSKTRQSSLEEFALWNKRIKHYDSVVNRKEFPLKIATRVVENKLEDAFNDEMNKEIKTLAKLKSYYYEDIILPDIVRDDNADTEEKPEEDIDGIIMFDTNLRECVRITADWIENLQAKCIILDFSPQRSLGIQTLK
ncbi:MAG: carboxy terminal-processing peptidase [Puniceicoccales bacterium]|jgi:carboxyl-terminal processing protease|nr:carboxy terminal-processing peptidase [Puniceicoccales bacterium]